MADRGGSRLVPSAGRGLENKVVFPELSFMLVGTRWAGPEDTLFPSHNINSAFISQSCGNYLFFF